MTAVAEDTIFEGAILEDEMRVSRRRERDEALVPEGFDPAAAFLLRMPFVNLFEEVSAGVGCDSNFRCKGCRVVVSRRKREQHWRQHRRSYERREARNREETRVARTKRLAKAREARQEPQARSDEDVSVGDAGPLDQERGKHELEAEAEDRADAPKPARGPRQKAAAVEGGIETSKATLAALVEKAQERIEGLTTQTNDKVGYTAIKAQGKLIGYGWLSAKGDLRVEAAVTVEEAGDERVVLCKRSKDMAARTRITADGDGFELALRLLGMAAIKKRQAVS